MVSALLGVHQEGRDLEEWTEGCFNLPVQYIPAISGGQNAEGWGFDGTVTTVLPREKYLMRWDPPHGDFVQRIR
jgi:hypothetical protein